MRHRLCLYNRDNILQAISECRAYVTMVPMTPGAVTAHAQTETAPSVSRSAETGSETSGESRSQHWSVVSDNTVKIDILRKLAIV